MQLDLCEFTDRGKRPRVAIRERTISPGSERPFLLRFDLVPGHLRACDSPASIESLEQFPNVFNSVLLIRGERRIRRQYDQASDPCRGRDKVPNTIVRREHARTPGLSRSRRCSVTVHRQVRGTDPFSRTNGASAPDRVHGSGLFFAVKMRQSPTREQLRWSAFYRLPIHIQMVFRQSP